MMDRFPPPAERQVTAENWRLPPFNRWAFQHLREIAPTAAVEEDAERRWQLPRALREIGGLRFALPGGGQSDIAAWLEDSHADGLLVLSQGTIVAEQYRNGLTPRQPHIIFSLTKSLIGLLVGILADQGRLDPEAPVTRYVPEVTGGFADASVRHLLDMLTSLDYDETLPESDPVVRYREAVAWVPPRDPARLSDLRSFLTTLGRGPGPHGEVVRYLSPNSDLLGWICERAAGRPLAELLSTLLWQPLGAEHAAYITLDRLGAPRATGGFACTLRDLARVGEMVRCRGLADGRQVVPGWWIDDILTQGSPEAWARCNFADLLPAGARYRSQWYLPDARGSVILGIGLHGQWLWIDRSRGVTIARLASRPLPFTEGAHAIEQAAFAAIAAFVAG